MLRKILLTALLIGGFATQAAAGPPSYLLLRQTQSVAPAHHGAAVGQPVEVQAQAYAYGWFGAAPRKHAQRHFGYYRDYTQWSSW